jgi:hypothetical protein
VCVTTDRVWICECIYWPLTHDSEVQATTTLQLPSTIHKSPQHPLSLFPARCVFTSRSLTTASNSGDSSASHAQVPSLNLPWRTQLNWQLCLLLIISRHGPHIKHPVSNSNSIGTCVFVAAGTCLPSRFPETIVVSSHRLAMSLYTTILYI